MPENAREVPKMSEKKTDSAAPAKLEKSVVTKSWLNWLFHNQACYNYERMQGVGFLHAMVPVINRLYKDNPEEKKAAMMRHTAFFNSEPCFGSPIVGLTVAMEEKRAEGADFDDDAINSVKSGLMGPASGIGDTVIQGVLVPLLLAFAISISVSGNLVGPVLYGVVITAIILGISYLGFMLGYRKGNEAIVTMLESGVINKVVTGAGIMGCIVLGALVSNYVSLSCVIQVAQGSGKAFDIQKQLFDVICPKILPLLLTFGCYKLMEKGHSSIRVMLYIIAFGVVGGFLGII
jgi:PTS system mannose-specific IID component